MVNKKAQGLPESLRIYCHWHLIELSETCSALPHIYAELQWFAIEQVTFEQTHNLVELDLFLCAKDGLKLTVKVNVAPIICVIKSVLLDILPEGGNYARTGLLFDA